GVDGTGLLPALSLRGREGHVRGADPMNRLSPVRAPPAPRQLHDRATASNKARTQKGPRQEKTQAKLGAIAVAGMLAVPAMAAAHVTAAPTEAPADSYAHLDFSVPHGCEGSPPTRIAVQIPESVPSVTPQRNPFWDLKVKE